MNQIHVEVIEIENLRGYSKTSLRLRPLTILVGENNQGKSSLLKMFEWVMRSRHEFWASDRELSDLDFDFWHPANNTKHKARRFSMILRFGDGRAARPYGLRRGDTILWRLAIGMSDRTCRLNVGPPKRSETHDGLAQHLLATLQRSTRLVVLPPIRDGKSSTFADKVTRDVRARIDKKVRHSRRAGAPKEYRLVNEILFKLKQIVALNTGELAKASDSPLGSMLRSSEVRLDVYPTQIYELIASALTVYLSTGDHDVLKVQPGDVGNGLQSLLDISLSIEEVLSGAAGARAIVVIEEPEAFLHPSAQRQFMQFLRRAMNDKIQSAILTTHSPIIVDEAKYGEIVIVRDQKHYEPSTHDSRRASINTTLTTTIGAEVLFARTVCFVEGEGDKALFGTLLRRIRSKVPVRAEMTGVVLQITGGCTRYAPWLHLVRSYARGADVAVRPVWIMDGDAASASDGHRAVLGLATECAFCLAPTEQDAVRAFGDRQWGIPERGIGANDAANQVLRVHGGYLFCCDVEWACFNGATAETLKAIRAALTLAGVSTQGTNVELARRLGSKVETGTASGGARKDPFIRTLIGEQLDLGALPPEIHSAVVHILRACFASPAAADAVLVAAGVKAGAP